MALLPLLAATIFSSILYTVSLIYEFMEFVWPACNVVCIIILLFITTALYCSVLLVLEMFVVIAATFYKSFKTYHQNKRKIQNVLDIFKCGNLNQFTC